MKLHNNIAILEGDEWISRWIQESGRIDHDLAVRGTICPLIPVGGTVIDGGANIGSHTVPYAERVGPNGKVIAFEPNLLALECLKHNVREYPWVQCSTSALSDKEGFETMQFDAVNPGGSHLARTGVKVFSITIDLLELTACDLIKLDIEGAELLALRGGEKTIRNLRPILVLEICRGHMMRATGTTPEELNELLSEWRYRVEALSGVIGSDQYDVIARPN